MVLAKRVEINRLGGAASAKKRFSLIAFREAGRSFEEISWLLKDPANTMLATFDVPSDDCKEVHLLISKKRDSQSEKRGRELANERGDCNYPAR